jgi:hypothetical protein
MSKGAVGHIMDTSPDIVPLPRNHLQLFHLCANTLPFNNLLKLVAVSESSDVNKNDTTFSPTTLLLILKVKFDQVASTQPPIMKVNIYT